MQKITNGRSEASKKSSSGRPISVTNEENTDIVAQTLKKDRRFTCEEISHDTGISRSPVHTILTEGLGMRKITAMWVTHFLSKKKGGNKI